MWPRVSILNQTPVPTYTCATPSHDSALPAASIDSRRLHLKELELQQRHGALADHEPAGLHHDPHDLAGDLFLDLGRLGLDVHTSASTVGILLLKYDFLPAFSADYLSISIEAEGQSFVHPAASEKGARGPGPQQ